MRYEKEKEKEKKMKADKHNSREYSEHGQVVKVRRGESSAGRERTTGCAGSPVDGEVEEGQVRRKNHGVNHGENDSQERREL